VQNKHDGRYIDHLVTAGHFTSVRVTSVIKFSNRNWKGKNSIHLLAVTRRQFWLQLNNQFSRVEFDR